ncbi:MAG: cupin domain-containing protein [Rhodanobacteraceae bacterium]|nr:cupin domain-containing protein [Rhodanobacteraceae bacterium]
MHRFLFLVCLFISPPALALESGAAVKVTPLLKTTTSWDGKPLVFPSGQAEVSAIIVEIAPGGETGWHLHPVPSFGVVLEGTLEVRLEDGRLRRVAQGEALAEVVSTLHNGRNIGDTPLKLLVFYAGSVGTPLTQKPDAAKP